MLIIQHPMSLNFQKKNLQMLISWWLNQPIWKICLSNWIISAGFGMKIKNVWNHQLVVVDFVSQSPIPFFQKRPTGIEWETSFQKRTFWWISGRPNSSPMRHRPPGEFWSKNRRVSSAFLYILHPRKQKSEEKIPPCKETCDLWWSFSKLVNLKFSGLSSDSTPKTNCMY